MIKGIRHIGFGYRDMRAVELLWQDSLGFKLVWNQTEGGEYVSKLWGINLELLQTNKYQAPDGSVIEFIHQPPWLQHINFIHIALTTDDIEEDYRRLVSREWYFISSPILSPNKDCKVATMVDPNGIIIELVEVIKEWIPKQ